MTISLPSEAKITNIDSYALRDPVNRKNLGSSSNLDLEIKNITGHSVELRILDFWSYVS